MNDMTLFYDGSIEYYMIDGIKIYTGNTMETRCQFEQHINYYKARLTNPILTTLNPSTLTAKGMLSNISFNEEDIIGMLSEPSDGNILKIGCNFGEIINNSSNYTKTLPKMRISNRGRKPKVKPKSKRKLQGSGKYFSSQITFEIFNPANNKIYKIKLFRNGKFQVPGVIKPDISDIIYPVKTLQEYIKNEFMHENIKIKFLASVMRNYTSRIIDDNLLVHLNKLEEMFINEKKIEKDNEKIIKLVEDRLGCDISCKIIEYLGIAYPIMIAEIQNNCERYFGLIVKFHRPVPWKLDKKTTIKFLRSGKVNFDGGNSIEEIMELYYWLQYFYERHKNFILHDMSIIENTSEDSDGSGYESLYDY